MILQGNIMEKIHTQIKCTTLTVRRELEFGNFMVGCPIREVFLREREPHWPIHSNWKCKTSNIFTCHDETVTLIFNLNQLFYFQNISFPFSANKSKHTTSNLKYLKRQKVERGPLIFIFRGEFPDGGNQGNADIHLHTMNS